MEVKSDFQSSEEMQKWDEEDEKQIIENVGNVLKDQISLSKEGNFSETLNIDSKGDLELMTSKGDLTSFFCHMAQFEEAKGNEAVYSLAKKVSDKFPELSFNFEENPERTQVKYSVTNTQQQVK